MSHSRIQQTHFWVKLPSLSFPITCLLVPFPGHLYFHNNNNNNNMYVFRSNHMKLHSCRSKGSNRHNVPSISNYFTDRSLFNLDANPMNQE